MRGPLFVVTIACAAVSVVLLAISFAMLLGISYWARRAERA